MLAELDKIAFGQRIRCGQRSGVFADNMPRTAMCYAFQPAIKG